MLLIGERVWNSLVGLVLICAVFVTIYLTNSLAQDIEALHEMDRLSFMDRTALHAEVDAIRRQIDAGFEARGKDMAQIKKQLEGLADKLQ